MHTIFEELLSHDGKLVYKTKGVSMQPMLQQNRDLVIIQAPVCRLKKYDVALYKRDDQYILHRVVKVMPDHYLIRGDNTYSLEYVPDSDVIGILMGFQRKGKQYSVIDTSYLLYVHIWQAIYPLRALSVRLHHFSVRIAHKLGIAPLLKKILRKGGGE
jgi:Peptidase S24-like.